MTALLEGTPQATAPWPLQVHHQEDTLTVKIVERDDAALDIVSLVFERLDGQEFPAWSPGAHIDVFLGNDAAGNPIVRQYSLCSDPHNLRQWRIGVLKDPKSRGGSVKLHETLKVGSIITIRGPRNHFQVQAADEYVFLAGGIGITPILPMVKQAHARGVPWRLVYLARNEARMAFLDEIAELPAEKVHLHSDELDGFIDLPSLTAQFANGTELYACGPGVLLDALEDLAQSEPTPGWTFRCERFVAAPLPPASEETPFEVHLAKSDQSFTIPAGVSCLSVLKEAGVDVDWSCSEGVCGTCETEVLEGEPLHRDSVLTPEEREANETMMLCVSRARSARIVLDL